MDNLLFKKCYLISIYLLGFLNKFINWIIHFIFKFQFIHPLKHIKECSEIHLVIYNIRENNIFHWIILMENQLTFFFLPFSLLNHFPNKINKVIPFFPKLPMVSKKIKINYLLICRLFGDKPCHFRGNFQKHLKFY